MAVTSIDSDGLVRFRDETRETIIKSGLSGVAATVLAVAMASPAGLGGMIGTSLASGSDQAGGSEALAGLAPYPTPLTATELTDIRDRLADAEATLEAQRAGTDVHIEHMRALSARAGLTVAPVEMTQIRGRAATQEAAMQTVSAPARIAPIEAVEVAAPPARVALHFEVPVAELHSEANLVVFAADDDGLVSF